MMLRVAKGGMSGMGGLADSFVRGSARAWAAVLIILLTASHARSDAIAYARTFCKSGPVRAVATPGIGLE